MNEFEGIEKIKANKETLTERLEKTQEILLDIGSVNLRSLEVYDSVKKEYDSIKEKMHVIEGEKAKHNECNQRNRFQKKENFHENFNALNEIFSRNFSELNSERAGLP